MYLGILYGAGQKLSKRRQRKLKEINEQLVTECHQMYMQKSPNDAEFLLTLVTHAASFLEKNENLNCGFGSQLNVNGEVECDSSLMMLLDGKRVFASVGAVPNLACPTRLTSQLLARQLFMKQLGTRALSNILVGKGAADAAEMLGLDTQSGNTLISEKSLQTYKSRIEPPMYTDTIGIIAIYNHQILICSSSGGPPLKDAGRLGPAAIRGSGFDLNLESACVCSGFGEDMNTIQLASQALLNDDLTTIVNGNQDFYMQRPPSFGVLKCITSNKQTKFEFSHTTDSMTIAISEITKQNTKINFTYSLNGHGGISYYNTDHQNRQDQV